MSNPPRRPIDPLLQQRLEQLGPRRAAQPLPPPTPGTVRATDASSAKSAAAKQAAARQAQARQAAGVQQQSRHQQAPASAQPTRQMPVQGKARATTTVSTTPTPDARAEALAARVAALNSRGQGGNRTGGSGARPGSARPGAPRTGAQPAGRRAKPARSSKMAALGISVVTTASLTALFAHNNNSSKILLGSGTAGRTPATAAPTASAAPSASASPTPAATTGAIKNGTYTGGASQNRWGTVQVAVVYSGGKIADVKILQYPDSHQKSVWINQQALPMLISETVQAQSAQIDSIGGATYTSYSYADSLQSAIDAAKQASGVKA